MPDGLAQNNDDVSTKCELLLLFVNDAPPIIEPVGSNDGLRVSDFTAVVTSLKKCDIPRSTKFVR